MPEHDDEIEGAAGTPASADAEIATARLEQALERIALAAHGRGQSAGSPAEAARRLDAVIASLRAALGE